MTKTVEITSGPLDPGGQPDTRIGQPMELGFFAWNIQGGMTASKAILSDPDRMQTYWRWPIARRLVQLAEQVGFDYQVPFTRWIGQGGPTGYSDSSLDFVSSAAALAPITSRLGLFSTAHVTYNFHPLHFAKIGATIDHISDGRWGLNIVSGYSAKEMAAFGIREPIPRDVAYEMADEFTTLLKHLWAEDEPIDFEGRYYRAYGAFVSPKPTRRPRPIVMSAGQSDAGLDFACRQADWVFCVAPTLPEYADRVRDIHRLAAEHGRDVRVSTMVYVVIDHSDAAAQRTMEWLEEEVDREAMTAFLESMQRTAYAREFDLAGRDAADPWGGVGRETYLRLALGIGAWQLVGGPETIAEGIRTLHDVGVEGIAVCFVDPLMGLHLTEDRLMPILKKMRLRN